MLVKWYVWKVSQFDKDAHWLSNRESKETFNEGGATKTLKYHSWVSFSWTMIESYHNLDSGCTPSVFILVGIKFLIVVIGNKKWTIIISFLSDIHLKLWLEEIEKKHSLDACRLLKQNICSSPLPFLLPLFPQQQLLQISLFSIQTKGIHQDTSFFNWYWDRRVPHDLIIC